jgi:hypothetical protein
MKYMTVFTFISILIGCTNNNSISSDLKADSYLKAPDQIKFQTFETVLNKHVGNHTYQFLNCAIVRNETYLVFYDIENNEIVPYHLMKGQDSTLNYGALTESLSEAKVVFANDTSMYLLGSDLVLKKKTKSGLTTIQNLYHQLQKQKLSVEQSRLEFAFQVTSDSLLFLPLHVDPFSKGYVKMYDYPMTAVYNLNTGEIKTTGILYPKHYHENDYGLIRTINQIYPPNKIIYNPQAQDQVWEYDIRTDSITKHTFRSRFQEREILPLNFKSTPKTKDQLVKHRDLSGEYTHLVYDPYKKVYYRFFKHFRPEKGADGFYLTYLDDVYSLIVADENFNFLGEMVLPKPCFFIYFAYATPNGLIINNGSLFGERNNEINVRTITFDFLN